MFLKCLGFCRSKYTADTSSSQRQHPTVVEELCLQFSLADLRNSTNNFDQNRLIRNGRFRNVYKGRLQHNDASDYTVAVKRSPRWEQFKKETELLCQLRHPNCISLIGFCIDENKKVLVYDYMSSGSLDQHLQGGDRKALPWKKRLEICIGVARGLHYLHTGAKRTIIHRNINLGSILLDDTMLPKLARFGYSIQGARFMAKPKPIKVDFVVGNFGYVALEYAMHGTITDKTDVYSFGMVLLEVVCGGKYVEMEEKTEFFEKLDVEEKIDPNIKGKIAPEC